MEKNDVSISMTKEELSRMIHDEAADVASELNLNMTRAHLEDDIALIEGIRDAKFSELLQKYNKALDSLR
jgi:hypothetical protein